MVPRFSLLVATLILASASVPLRAAEVPLLDKSGHPPTLRKLAIGDRAPDFSLPGIDGRT